MLSKLVDGRPLIARGYDTSPRLALLFDDGPNPVHTPRLIELLSSHGIRATFFLVGAAIEAHPEIVRTLVEGGHELGNHSYRHTRFSNLALRAQLDEIDLTEALLRRHDGRESHVFYPPQGRLSMSLFVALRLRQQRVVMGVYDSLDYTGEGTHAIVQMFAKVPVTHGDVVQFHDDNEHTVTALEELIPAWRRLDFSFATVSQLLGS